MPEAVAMPRSIPHQLGSEAELLDELMQRVHAVEVEVAAERHRTGRRVCGRRMPRTRPTLPHARNA
jgi:hypothetical protein